MKKDYRLGKDTTEHYDSFESLGEAWGCKPKQKRTSDKNKLQKQQEKFLKTCRVCKQPLTWIEGTNLVCCTNPDCKGFKVDRKDAEGKEIRIPVSRVLDEKGFEIAINLFEE